MDDDVGGARTELNMAGGRRWWGLRRMGEALTGPMREEQGFGAKAGKVEGRTKLEIKGGLVAGKG
jgi:hypothetical protein